MKALLFKPRSGTCDENTFWECVEEIGWPTNDREDLIKPRLLRAWSIEFGISFVEIMGAKVRRVREIFLAKEREIDPDERSYYLGSDGFDDFANHIVGLGKKVFEAETSNPNLMIQRAEKSDYVESFAYVIPYTPRTDLPFEAWAEKRQKIIAEEHWKPDPEFNPDETFEEHIADLREEWEGALAGDWREICPEHHAHNAGKILPETAAFLSALSDIENPTEEEQRAAAGAATFQHWLMLVMQSKTYEAIEISEAALRAWWDIYHIIEDLGGLRGKHADLSPTSGHKYFGENIINDHRRFMGVHPGFRCQHHLQQIREAAKAS